MWYIKTILFGFDYAMMILRKECFKYEAESREWFVKKGEKSIPLEFYYYYNKRTHKSMTIEEFYKFITDIRKNGSLDEEQLQESVQIDYLNM